MLADGAADFHRSHPSVRDKLSLPARRFRDEYPLGVTGPPGWTDHRARRAVLQRVARKSRQLGGRPTIVELSERSMSDGPRVREPLGRPAMSSTPYVSPAIRPPQRLRPGGPRGILRFRRIAPQRSPRLSTARHADWTLRSPGCRHRTCEVAAWAGPGGTGRIRAGIASSTQRFSGRGFLCASHFLRAVPLTSSSLTFLSAVPMASTARQRVSAIFGQGSVLRTVHGSDSQGT